MNRAFFALLGCALGCGRSVQAAPTRATSAQTWPTNAPIAPVPIAPVPITPVPTPPARPTPPPAPASSHGATTPSVPAADKPVGPSPGKRWLRGSTHVHAAPSGDSRTEVPAVIKWYRDRGYDFIVLSDHNRVTTLPTPARDPRAIADDNGLIVIAGIELTHNPGACEPHVGLEVPIRCRIHVNALGVTQRPTGRLVWAKPGLRMRLEQYRHALATATQLGAALVQINHPNWHWGMNAELLTTLANDGIALVEIANKQFPSWNLGDATHPSLEQQWDAALVRGATIWGVASDDAHDYNDAGKYPAGGNYVMVWAEPTPASILDALAHGAFYATSGVTLTQALPTSTDNATLEVANAAACQFTMIRDGQVAEQRNGTRIELARPATGYVRAKVVCPDGTMAWTQPWRAPSEHATPPNRVP